MDRMRLRPGFRVLRRGPDQVQIGLDPRHALVLPLTGAVRRTLEVLAENGPSAAADAAVVARLVQHGALADEADPPSGRVCLCGFGDAPWTGVASLLAEAGLDVVGPGEPSDVGLLVGLGEPDRALLDPWVATGLPHLVVRVSEGAAVVGPFVVPGRTACLRCVDGHHTDSDPRWPLLVQQQVAATAADAPADPADAAAPSMLALATSWAVSDVLTHLDGGRPATWSATLRLPDALGGVELVGWLRHAQCGCTWNEADHLWGGLALTSGARGWGI